MCHLVRDPSRAPKLDRIAFEDVPPGRCVLKRQPNLSSRDQYTSPVPANLKGSQTTEVTLFTR